MEPRRPSAKPGDLDPEVGYQYYIAFKPAAIFDGEEVRSHVPVEVVVSITENGDLADASFELPKPLQNEPALEYVRAHENASYTLPRVYVVVPNRNGDTVLPAAGNIDLDIENRILGLEIHWSPAEEAELAD